MRRDRYEDGAELTYTLQFVEPVAPAKVKVRLERFVGGGFAGQVYRVQVLSLSQNGQNVDSCGGLAVGGFYAIKILIPPSHLGCAFRNFLYAVGFQGMFQLQVNPAAAKAGALWQKFIRQVAATQFGDEKSVNNVHALFVDTTLGSCGEISDWVEGRTWRLEVDNYMDILKLWRKKRFTEHENLGSPEYRAKYQFMHDFVKLLHDMGAHELARQYEWTTCKSQLNVLKRLDAGDNPKAGLTAIHFRAGLTLLPFGPMSPGDFKLIGQGLMRGSLVQFDRGDIGKLEEFIGTNPQAFSSMPNCGQMLDQLKECERIYRNSVPDITHNHIRLLTDGNLRATICQSLRQGWKIRGLIDEPMEKILGASKTKFVMFWLLGLIPLLGRFLRRFWGRADYRAHYKSILQPVYFLRAFRGHISEALIAGYRNGRLNPAMAAFITEHPLWYLAHLPLLILPAGLHRFLTDGEVFHDKIYSLFVCPFKLCCNAHLRNPRNPRLREIVSHWATEAAHHLPVFGERGALFERWVFGLCYNWPLTIRRRMNKIAEIRKKQTPNYLHLPFVVGLCGALLISIHQMYHNKTNLLPQQDNLWYLRKVWPFVGPILCGGFVGFLAGGMPMLRRIISSVACGAVLAILYSVAAFFLERSWYPEQQIELIKPMILRTFGFVILSTLATLLREIRLKDPDFRNL
jgi:hypothetical protein